MFCVKCGKQLEDGTTFCTECGCKTGSGSVQQQRSVTVQRENNVYIPGAKPGYDYSPLGMWAYFGLSILFGMPMIGFILAIVLSFAPRNVNLRNYSRSFFCVYIIAFVLSVFAFILAIGLSGSLDSVLDGIRQFFIELEYMF